MKLKGETPRKSYEEQFQLRQKLGGKSPEELSFKRLFTDSSIKKVKRGQLLPAGKKSKSQTSVRSASSRQPVSVHVAPREVSLSSSPLTTKKSENSLPAINNTGPVIPLRDRSPETQVGRPRSFSGMVRDYAKSLNLTEMERQCLGFGDDVDDLEEQATSSKGLSEWTWMMDENNNLEGDENPSLAESAHDHLAPPVPTPPTPKDKLESPDSSSSNWTKLASWLGMNLSEEKKISRENDDKLEVASDDDADDKAQTSSRASSKVGPHKLLKSGLLSLLEKACLDEHKNGNAGNCFKCQHKDCFRSLTLNYIDEMRYIWKDKHLSSRKKDKKLLEVLQVWTYQLAEQNLSLAEAYSVSVQNADKLKGVLLHSRTSMRHHQKQMDKQKCRNDAISYELSLREQTISKLRVQLDYESDQRREISRKLEETLADVNSLTELILRLRDKGVWDIHGLPMGNETFQKIFHQDYYLHGSKVIGSKEFSQKRKEWRNEIELLKVESDTLRQIIATKDREIQRMKIQAVSSASARTRSRIE